MELSCVFINQLENQRLFFESKIKEFEDLRIQTDKINRNRVGFSL